MEFCLLCLLCNVFIYLFDSLLYKDIFVDASGGSSNAKIVLAWAQYLSVFSWYGIFHKVFLHWVFFGAYITYQLDILDSRYNSGDFVLAW